MTATSSTEIEPHHPTLVVIRGNSGSGKTTTARELRRRYGRGCALIELSHRPLGVRDVHESGGS